MNYYIQLLMMVVCFFDLFLFQIGLQVVNAAKVVISNRTVDWSPNRLANKQPHRSYVMLRKNAELALRKGRFINCVDFVLTLSSVVNLWQDPAGRVIRSPFSTQIRTHLSVSSLMSKQPEPSKTKRISSSACKCSAQNIFS